jgi:8-oxo-dGTP diphosphatase
MAEDAAFEGAKVALFLGEKLVVILRDELPGLSFAGHWDFPGGGREAEETPFECVARECEEELGLHLRARDVRWQQPYASSVTATGLVWFFVACLPEKAVHDVMFGNEGQRWTLMTPDAFIAHPKAVPAFQKRLCDWYDGFSV